MSAAAQADAPRSSRRRVAGAAGPALLLLAVGLLLAPVVAGRAPLPDYLRWFAPWAAGQAPRTAWNALWYDAVGQYWPWRTLLADGLRNNCLPLWNPYQLNGYAFCGNGQSALWYPPNWLCFGLLPVADGFRLTAVLHLWLAATGAWLLARQLGAGRPGALLAGLVYGLGGFNVTWLLLPTLVSSAAWLPWALWQVERASATGRWRHAVWAGGCVGLAGLAGHPQVFHYVAVTTLAVAAWRFGRRRVLVWLACAVTAGLVAAPMVLPLLELAPRSHRPPGRSAAGYEAFGGRAIPLDRLVTLALPRFYGDPARGTVDPAAPPAALLRQAADGAYWGSDRRGAISPGDYTEFNLFGGLLPLLAAALLLGRGARGQPARGYLGLALLALLLALGGPPNRLLYWALPGYSAGAGPCRLALVWTLGLAIAAGCGVDRLAALPARRGWQLGAVAGVVLVGLVLLTRAALAARLGALLEVTWYGQLTALTAALGLLLAALALRRRPALVVALAAVELLWFGYGFNPTCERALLDPRPARLAPLAQRLERDGTRLLALDPPARWGFYHPPEGLLLPPNLATAAGLRDVGGYDSLLPAAAKQAMSWAAGGRQPAPAINGNMLLLGDVDPRRVAGAVSQVLSRERPLGALPSGTPEVWSARPAATARCFAVIDGQPPRPAVQRTLYDGVNRAAWRLPPVSSLLLDSAAPGWRVYLGPLASPALQPAAWIRAPFQPPYDQGRFVPNMALAAGGGFADQRVQWVFAPTSVRVGLFAGLLGVALLLAAWTAGEKRDGSLRTAADGAGPEPDSAR
ncbi:MAG: hypothetical protein IT204_23245 [Fimbriimonadaceae bacterium]|nr:hypothetical protein [Fimbriimonadaceae bacterium]